MIVTYTITLGPVPDRRNHLLDVTIDRMLGMINAAAYQVDRCGNVFTISIAGAVIALDPDAASFEHQLERLASAVEATVAYERASTMLVAAEARTGLLPLWLSTGSNVLAQWLVWSRGEMALRRVLRLSDEVAVAPVTGMLERTARIALGQTAARIRVANGLAVAEKIELAGRRRCVMALGRKAELTIKIGAIPATIVAALRGRNLSALVDHPFVAATHFVITAARHDGEMLIVEIAHEQGPLAPVPDAALAVVPADANPVCPWRPTRMEVAQLYALVDLLRGHEQGVRSREIRRDHR